VDELRELYQQLILDHNKSPRNFHVMDEPCESTEGYNPLCGDKLTLYVKIEDDVVADISFVGSGCAISKASASIMTEEIKGKPVDEAKVIFENFRDMITTGKVNKEELGKLYEDARKMLIGGFAHEIVNGIGYTPIKDSLNIFLDNYLT